MFWISLCPTLHSMQLIQIGEVRQKTVLEMIHEIAERQFAEIEKLKAAAKNRAGEQRPCRVARGRRTTISSTI